MRRKTTYLISEELVRATKIAAAREDKPEYQIVEDALRKHLGGDLIARIRERAAMPESAAAKLAVAESRAARKSRRKSRA
ncbi:MAG: hypothetical protein ACYDCC_05545 [Actinomycetota bacterium]